MLTPFRRSLRSPNAFVFLNCGQTTRSPAPTQRKSEQQVETTKIAVLTEQEKQGYSVPGRILTGRCLFPKQVSLTQQCFFFAGNDEGNAQRLCQTFFLQREPKVLTGEG